MNIAIDNAPAIKAFAEERIRQIESWLGPILGSARIDELQRIVRLCNGLMKQAEMMQGAHCRLVRLAWPPEKAITTP